MKKLTTTTLSTKHGPEYWEFGFAFWSQRSRAHMAALFAVGCRIHADRQAARIALFSSVTTPNPSTVRLTPQSPSRIIHRDEGSVVFAATVVPAASKSHYSARGFRSRRPPSG